MADDEHCLLMQDSKEDREFLWFGGPELFVQMWPLNKVDIFSAPFLTTDLPELYGNVLERYFLSSSGAGVFVDDTSSLFVSHLSNREICFEVSIASWGKNCKSRLTRPRKLSKCFMVVGKKTRAFFYWIGHRKLIETFLIKMTHLLQQGTDLI